MRRVKHILDNKEKLEGQHAALLRCVDKSTTSRWGRAIEVMTKVAISQREHVQPSHAVEIARAAPQEDWARWVDDCEQAKWTVVELRAQLHGNGENVVVPRHADTYLKAVKHFLIAIQNAQEMQEHVRPVAKLLRAKHEAVRRALAQLERILADSGDAE